MGPFQDWLETLESTPTLLKERIGFRSDGTQYLRGFYACLGPPGEALRGGMPMGENNPFRNALRQDDGKGRPLATHAFLRGVFLLEHPMDGPLRPYIMMGASTEYERPIELIYELFEDVVESGHLWAHQGRYVHRIVIRTRQSVLFFVKDPALELSRQMDLFNGPRFLSNDQNLQLLSTVRCTLVNRVVDMRVYHTERTVMGFVPMFFPDLTPPNKETPDDDRPDTRPTDGSDDGEPRGFSGC